MANTKKRVLSLLMALVMTLGLLPISALAEEEGELTTSIEQEQRANYSWHTYTVQIDIKTEDTWLEGKKVTIQTFDEDKNVIESYESTTTGEVFGKHGGRVSDLFTTQKKPKFVKVTYGEKVGTATLEKKDLKYTATVNLVGEVTPPPAVDSNLTKDDQKLLNSLADKTHQTFKVYSYYSNRVPAKINQGFDADDFGPSHDDTPYFTVTVDMAMLLARPGMDCNYDNDNGHWYVSLESCTGTCKDLETFWANVVACITNGGADQFEEFFSNNYCAYVLKREGGQNPSYHMDGIFKVNPPYYITEWSLDGAVVGTSGAEAPQALQFVKTSYEDKLAEQYGQGSMNWNADSWQYKTDAGDIYQVSKAEIKDSHGNAVNTWPVKDGKIEYANPGEARIFNARFYASTEKLTHTYTVNYQFEYSTDGGKNFTSAGTEVEVSAPSKTGPTTEKIEELTPAIKNHAVPELGNHDYTLNGTVVPSGDFTLDSLTYTATYRYTAPVEHTVTYKWADGSNEAMKTALTLPDPTKNIKDWADFTPATLPTLTTDQTDDGYSMGTTWYTDATHTIAYEEGKPVTGDTLYAYCNYTAPGKVSLSYQFTANSVKPEDEKHPLLKNVLPENPADMTPNQLKNYSLPTLGDTTELSTAGYTFEGWYSDEAGTTKITTNTVNKTTSTTVYAKFSFKAPEFPYYVRYEYMLKQNGATDFTSQGVSDKISKTSTGTQPTKEIAWGVCESRVKDDNTYVRHNPYVASDVTESTEAGLTLYTVKLYCEKWTQGSLKITKTIAGLGANEEALETLKDNLKFKVTGPDNWVSDTYTYTQVMNGLTIYNLLPGTYTVEEINATVNGYTLKTTGNFSATVAAKPEPATISITNTYESKPYQIIFEAGDHGVLTAGKTYTDGHVDGQMTYTWSAMQGTTPGWSYQSTNGLSNKKIVYEVDAATYLAGGMTLPDQSIDPAAGYTWTNKTFTEVGGKQATYNDMATTMDALLASGETSITYAAAPCTAEEVGYTVKYIYQDRNGSYANGHMVESDPRPGTTGATVEVTDDDKAPRTYDKLHYVFDDAKSEFLSDTVNGNGTTALRVFFKWQAGVTYEYKVEGAQKFPESILKAHPLPEDKTPYYFGNPVTNNGKPITDNSDPAGTWNLTWAKAEDTMTADGVTFVGTWTFVPVGQAVVQVKFVDQAGNPLTVPGYSTTAKIGTAYNFTAAENVATITQSPYTYDFTKAYVGEFDAAKENATDIAYEGAIPEGGLTITRVYRVRTTSVELEKTYTGINALPTDFTITVRDSKGTVKATLTLADVKHTADGMVGFITTLPLGETYTFTESGYSNGAGWSTVLTAQQAEGQHATPRMALPSGYTMKDLTVNGYSFTAPVTVNELVNGDAVMIAMHNAYTYTAPIDPQPIPPTEPDNDPDEGYGPGENPLENIVSPEVPLADLPETEIPLAELPETEIPETEVPLAEAPATGDNLAMWIMAAAISGLSLVWLMISGKKREDENAE